MILVLSILLLVPHAIASVFVLLALLLLTSMLLSLSMLLLALLLLLDFWCCWHCCIIMLHHDVLPVDFSPSHARKVFRTLKGELTHIEKSSGPWSGTLLLSPMPEKSGPWSEARSRSRGQTFLAQGNVQCLIPETLRLFRPCECKRSASMEQKTFPT